MNYEGWSSGATKLGWAMQIEQPAVAVKWVFSLGMRQLMVTRVLGSKMGLSRVGVGSGVTAWVTRWVSHFLCLASSFLFFSFFFFFSFVFGFSVWFRVLLIAGFSFLFLFFFFTYIYIYIYIF